MYQAGDPELSRLDPEFKKWLDNLKQPLPVINKEFIHAASQARQAGSQVETFRIAPESGDPEVAEEDHDIHTRDGTTRICVFKPVRENGVAPGPLIVIFHPGGFCFGDYKMVSNEARVFVRRFGATCVSVDYRLAPEHRFPAAAHDAWDSLRWVAANSRGPVLNSDPSKGFIVSGTSAGGTLAGVVSHLARDEHLEPPLTGVHLSVPGLMQLDAIPDRHKHEILSFHQNEFAPVLNLAAAKVLAETYAADIHSPLHNVFSNPNGHAGLPPHFIAVCGLDPVRDNAMVYERVLREEYRIPTKIDVYPGQVHAFWLVAGDLPVSTKYREDEIAGMEWLLSQKA